MPLFHWLAMGPLLLSLTLAIPRAMTPVEPSAASAAREVQSGVSTGPIRRHRLMGAGWGVLGAAGLAWTTTLQVGTLLGRSPCVRSSSGEANCLDPDGGAVAAMNAAGLSSFVLGAGGLGFALGRAAAYEDLRSGRSPKWGLMERALALSTILSLSKSFLIGGLTYRIEARECKTTVCWQQHRLARTMFVDVGTMVLALGTGMGGYWIGRRMQHRKLGQLRVAPGLSRTGAQLSLSGRF